MKHHSSLPGPTVIKEKENNIFLLLDFEIELSDSLTTESLQRFMLLRNKRWIWLYVLNFESGTCLEITR